MRLIVTDLDGTLVDHDTYSAEAARPALDAARRAGVPVVLCSSKTLAEMSALAGALDLAPAPLIVENGGAVWFPREWRFTPADAVDGPLGGRQVVLGAAAVTLRPYLPRLARATGLTLLGFSTMTDEDVAAHTGLPVGVAALARRREYSEPFLCVGADPATAVLDDAARVLGARVTRGGRFFHLIGDTDKGRAVRIVCGAIPGPTRTIGLGDAPNDLPLLQATDDAVIVAQPQGLHPAVVAALPRATHAPAPGPAGWNAAVLAWLRDASK